MKILNLKILNPNISFPKIRLHKKIFDYLELVAVATLFWLHASAQENKAPKLSVMQGFGAGYGFCATRVGIYSWELGLLNSGTNMSSFGITKIFRNGLFYSGIGPILFNTSMLGPTSPGVFAAVGLEHVFPLGIFSRLEMNAEATFDASTQASTLIMIGWSLW